MLSGAVGNVVTLLHGETADCEGSDGQSCCRAWRRAADLLLPTIGRMSADLADRLSRIVNMNDMKIKLMRKSLSACYTNYTDTGEDASPHSLPL